MVTHPVLFLTCKVIGEQSLKIYILYSLGNTHPGLHDSDYNRTQNFQGNTELNSRPVKYVCIPSNYEITVYYFVLHKCLPLWIGNCVWL